MKLPRPIEDAFNLATGTARDPSSYILRLANFTGVGALIMSVMDGINLAIALVGAILGIMATLHQWNESRVKLRVIPRRSYMVAENGWVHASHYEELAAATEGNCPARWTIEVVNLSSFPVTISAIWFPSKDGKGSHYIIAPEVDRKRPFPTRLESREAAQFSAAIGVELCANTKAEVFVRTDCDSTCRGTSHILTALLARSADATNLR